MWLASTVQAQWVIIKRELWELSRNSSVQLPNESQPCKHAFLRWRSQNLLCLFFSALPHVEGPSRHFPSTWRISFLIPLPIKIPGVLRILGLLLCCHDCRRNRVIQFQRQRRPKDKGQEEGWDGGFQDVGRGMACHRPALVPPGRLDSCSTQMGSSYPCLLFWRSLGFSISCLSKDSQKFPPDCRSWSTLKTFSGVQHPGHVKLKHPWCHEETANPNLSRMA